MARNILYYILTINHHLAVKLMPKRMSAHPPLRLQVRQINSHHAGEETVPASKSRGMREGSVTAGSQVRGHLKMLFLTRIFGQVYAGFTHNSSARQSQERSKVGKCLKLSAVLQRVLRPIPKATIVWEQGLLHCGHLCNLGNIITDLVFFQSTLHPSKDFNSLNTSIS